MSFRRNYRNFVPRGRGGHRSQFNNVVQDYGAGGSNNASRSVRTKSYYGNTGFMEQNMNDDENTIQENIDGATNKQDGDGGSEIKGKRNSIPNSVHFDLQTLKGFSKQFQTGEKKNWPKYLREMNNFLSSNSFPSSYLECPHRIYEEITRILTKIYLGKLYSDIVDELIQCATTLSKCLDLMHQDFFSWMFSIYFNKAAVDIEETRLAIRKTIYSVVKQSSNGVKENAFLVQKRLKKALEDETTLDMFLQTSELMIFVGDNFPTSFQFHFKDFIDILLGWFLDSRQPNLLIRPIEDVILSLGPYWRNDLSFSITLLSQFMEDFEKYYQEVLIDLNVKTIDKPKMNAQLHKMASLVRIFAMVLYQLELSQSDHHRLMTGIKLNFNPIEFFLHSIKRFMQVILEFKVLTNICFFEELLTECNLCICFLCRMIGSVISIVDSPELIEYVELLLDLCPSVSMKFTTSSLDLITVIVEKLNTELPISMVSTIFTHRFQQLKFCMIEDVQHSYFALLYTVLRIKSVPIVEHAYQNILKYLKSGLCTLYRFKTEKELSILPNVILSDEDKQFFDDKEDEQQCLISIHSDFALLAEIANSKHSLIATWALNPTFIDLALRHINPCIQWLTEDYPSISYSFIYLMYSYCTKHNNFIVQSSLLHASIPTIQTNSSSVFSLNNDKTNVAQKETDSTKSIINLPFKWNSTNGNHFVDILKQINLLLRINRLCTETVILCFKWVEAIVEYLNANISTKVSILINSNEFISLAETVSEYSFSNNYEVCSLSCRFIRHLLPLIQQDDGTNFCTTISNYKKACQTNIAHPDSNISELFLNLLSKLPYNSKSLDIISSSRSLIRVYSIQNESFLYPEETHLWIVCLMHKPLSESFSSHAFQMIIDFILYNKNSSNLEWLSRLFYSVFDVNQMKISSALRSTISYLPFISSNLSSCNVFNNNYWTLLFWACWELVQFCIENRLKTPLGKPQDTFTKIEASIKMFVSEISNGKQSSSPTSNDCDQANRQSTITRIHLLLMIMENFDKLINNAVSDNSMRLYLPSKLSKSFFKKNIRTCNEWINRNRRSIMILALKLNEPVLVIRHGEELLRDYQTDRSLFTMEEIEFILLLMIDALIQLQAPEAIVGYLIWTRDTFARNSRFEWIKTATNEAYCQYENALTEYQRLLEWKCKKTANEQENQEQLNLVTSNKNFICNSYKVNFFNERIANCFLHLERYEDAIEWSNRYESNFNNNLFHSQADYSYLSSLNEWTNLPSLNNTTNADIRFSSPVINLVPWDIESSFHTLQSRLFEMCCQFYECKDSTKLSNQLDDLQRNKLNPLLKSFYMCGLSSDGSEIANLQNVVQMLKELIEPRIDGPANQFNFNCNPNMNLLMNSLQWHKVFAKINLKIHAVDDGVMKQSLNDLILRTATTARKAKNFDLSRNLLCQFAESYFELKLFKPDENEISPESRLLNVFEHSLDKPISPNSIKFFTEISKLCHETDEQSSTATEVLLKSINVFVDDSLETNPAICESTSRLLLKLVDYIQLEPKHCDNDHFAKLNSLRSVSMIGETFSCIQSLEHSENIIGKLLLFSANTSPLLAKAWYRLADWSYKWGRKLSDTDEDKIESETVCKEDDVFSFYKLAANSYFKFLHISTHNGCDDVNATLRVLRLILKHAPELREILERGLKETPTKPWKNIILQLFSRLNHQQSYVRQSISDLLCRIGNDSPHLVIFPAVAGLLNDQSIKSKNYDYTATSSNVDEEEDDEEFNNSSLDSSIIQNCYTSLLDSLSVQNPNLITETKLFVHELRRITVLWDELWIGTLQHNLNEVKKQVSQLEREIEKTKLNTNLYENEKEMFIKEQHNIFFRRILYSLELTELITSDRPETPHELWFQNNFSQLITELINSIRHPENVYEPSTILYHYQNLLQVIRKRSFISSSNKLQMQDISPKLVQLENSVIPLPGLDVSSRLTLRKVMNTVSVLHTYTRPKKIVFVGSDGRNYTYLFKGHEDLHLDERIMQFLSIVNKMMVKFDPSFGPNRKLLCRARHYSVTPLGDKSGLIQWVEGGQALYNFYKKWLANRDLPLEEVNKKVSAVDVFKNKLVEKGISPEFRNELSSSSLVELYEELVAETPNDLIYKELWNSSVNSADYWNLTQNFITSNAIMSMIGYILGLGDRHLDNILLDLTSGEVIHIDYNICFEKGKYLRVPEKVLCRLTQNIVNAFGISGIEGTFRFSCEQVLKILRKEKETLLTLLEAFIYDPLVDWTPEHEEGYTGAIYGGARIAQLAKEGKIIPKKQMERENMEAIERLNQLIQSVAQRNTDWPSIMNDNDLIQCGELLMKGNDGSTSLSIIQGLSSSSEQSQSKPTKKNKRNAFAFSLDGRDFDANKRMAVCVQVNQVLKESMNVENLARMYEGWTSWV
ncbi:Serine/threonine-protein kinase smg1 [Blomia tropicalis]|nr:Serine/threonine-protein kinase smg1 [Blomia tropicalis]